MGDPALRELSSPSLADQCYDAIRRAIADGELGPGEKITERGLAGMLAVSATPVREAIRRLEQEGLIERRGQRTTVVFDARGTPSHELGLIEAALKSVAAALAATKATDEQVARMEAHLHEADAAAVEMRRSLAAGDEYPAEVAERLVLATQAFHAEIEAACDNAMLLRMLSTTEAFSFQRRVESLRDRSTDIEALEERHRQHHRLLDAIRRRDAGAAERLMADHATAAADFYTA